MIEKIRPRQLKLCQIIADKVLQRALLPRGESDVSGRHFPAAIFSISPVRASRTESSNSSRSSSNSARTCSPEICQRRKPISQPYNSRVRRSVRLRRIRIQAPSHRISNSCRRTSSLATFQPRSRTTRRSSRISRVSPLAKHAHHHHQGGGGGGASAISQLMQELGQDLQTGSLSAAQQAYSTLQQDFQQFAQSSGLFQSVGSVQSKHRLGKRLTVGFRQRRKLGRCAHRDLRKKYESQNRKLSSSGFHFVRSSFFMRLNPTGENGRHPRLVSARGCIGRAGW